MSNTCKHCGLELRGHDKEGDYCLDCLQSLTPHCSFDGGYYSPQALIKMGCIRQSQDIPLTDKEKEKEQT
jgi:hypothetical protein